MFLDVLLILIKGKGAKPSSKVFQLKARVYE